MGNVIKYIKEELLKEYDRFEFILEKLQGRLQRKYHKILDNLENESESLRDSNDAISFLATCLNEYYGKKVMVFIDE